ncbi:MAG TPA: Maf family protein [Limnochordia bacterium]|nr:Maf family protein [Limnochordia bacterium]
MLRGLGLQFEIAPVDLDERALAAGWGPLPPDELVLRLAQAKATEGRRQRPDAIVIAADTVVSLRQEVLGKPANPQDARAMLAKLSGRTHLVFTGVAVLGPGRPEYRACEATAVTFRTLDAATIARYVATGEPLDKAGAYGIQALGAVLVERIDGDYFNVVGLPVVKVAEALAPYGYQLP